MGQGARGVAGVAALQTRLRLLRTATGETQTALGQALGVGQRTVWGWESGRVKPDWEMLAALGDHFEVSVDYLIGRTDDPAPPRPASSPPLARWLRERLVERRTSVRALADATQVPLPVLLQIQEGTADEVAPQHLRALARHLGAAEEEVLAMAPGLHVSDANADPLSRVAAAAAEGLTDEERRQVEALIRRMRGRSRAEAPDRP